MEELISPISYAKITSADYLQVIFGLLLRSKKSDMKKWLGRILPGFLTCLIGIVALMIGIVYFSFISRRIYEDSTDHLEEIYSQVNRSFGAFVDRN